VRQIVLLRHGATEHDAAGRFLLERILRGLALDAKDVTPMEPSES
jgi:broad specificity phosphatase PhoE